jgi:tRNA G18 (ribose-2'-O)-methylase SpoU
LIQHDLAPGDPRLDPYRHVGDPAWLRGRGLFVAEGRLVVERLLEDPRYVLHSIAVTPAAFAAMTHLEKVVAPVFVCDRDLLHGVTGFDFHRGCLALVQRPQPLAGDSLLGARRLLIVEGVGNPDNVGGLFRTAAALGVDGVLLDATSGDPLYRKAIRTSMAATLRLPFAGTAHAVDAVRMLKGAGFKVVALTPAADAVPLDDYARAVRDDDKVAVMVGAEGSGLSGAALASADVRVRIPVDPRFDSLNVVVAAGIAFSALR